MKVFVFWVLAFVSLRSNSAEFQYIEVKHGQTLWEISQVYLKDPRKWDEIIKYNNLPPDPYQPLTGKKLKVPINLIKEEYRAAHFSKLVGDVRIRGVGSSAWNDGSKVKELFKGDAIRTNTNSYADVKFYTGQILNLFANSMVILRPPESKESDIRLLSGQVRAKDTSIITVSAKITPKTKNTELAAKIKEDLSTVVQVYKGEAEIEGKGEKVVLKEGFTTEVKINSIPVAPIKMPDIIQEAKIPKVDFNVDKNVISVKYAEAKMSDVEVGDQSKAKNLKLSDNVSIDLSKAVSGYRVQVAKDKEFKNIVLDRRFDVFKNLNLSNYLPKGKYYFRVSYIDLIGFEGEFSESKEVVIE